MWLIFARCVGSNQEFKVLAIFDIFLNLTIIHIDKFMLVNYNIGTTKIPVYDNTGMQFNDIPI